MSETVSFASPGCKLASLLFSAKFHLEEGINTELSFAFTIFFENSAFHLNHFVLSPAVREQEPA